MSTLRIIASVMLAVFFLAQTWAVRGHFQPNGSMAPGMRAVMMTGAISILWFVGERWDVLSGAVALPAWREILSILLLSLALTLFGWAVATTRERRLTLAFSDDLPEVLIDTGPYAYLRHPFYTSYMLFWIASGLEVPTPIYQAAPASMAVLYWIAAHREEDKFARSSLAGRYARYRARSARQLLARSDVRAGAAPP